MDENLTLIIKIESYFADFPVMVLAFKSVMWMKTCGQFNNTFTSVIYKCSYFATSETVTSLVNLIHL